MIDKLLIIGNGFDLQCGLKTSYNHFFEKRKEEEVFTKFIEIIVEIQKENLRKNYLLYFFNTYRDDLFSSLTIWDMIFIIKYIDNESVNWCDVEKEIYSSLQFDSIVSNVYRFCDRMNSVYVYDQLHNQNYMKVVSLLLYFRFSCRKINRIDDNVGRGAELTEIIKDWNRFLFDQLTIFENIFKTYILNQADKNKEASLKANRLYKKLVDTDRTLNEVNLMSFNYTQTINPSLLHTIENVHGKVSGMDKIILGIDNNSFEVSNPEYIFTKTYRKIFDRVYLDKTGFKPTVLKKSINTIIFYGHSLNEQDHSYFQTLFDYYNIYDNRITLIFNFSDYDGRSLDDIKEEQVKLVINLLSKYSKTLDNPHKGRNLIHKLLNEQRLYIEEVTI